MLNAYIVSDDVKVSSSANALIRIARIVARKGCVFSSRLGGLVLLYGSSLSPDCKR